MIVSSASPDCGSSRRSLAARVERRVEQQARHADHAVHRRPDLVAHRREKRALRLCRRQSGIPRHLKLLGLTQQQERLTVHFVARRFDLADVLLEVCLRRLAGCGLPINPHVSGAAAVERDRDVVALADDAVGEGHGLRCHAHTGSDDFLEPGDEPRGRSCNIAPSLRGDMHILADEVRRTRVGCKETTENVVRPNDLVIVVYEQECGFDVIDEHREAVNGSGRRSRLTCLRSGAA